MTICQRCGDPMPCDCPTTCSDCSEQLDEYGLCSTPACADERDRELHMDAISDASRGK